MVNIADVVEISEEVERGDIFGIVKLYNVADPAQPESSAARILSITYPTQALCQALKAVSERLLGQRPHGTFLFAGGYGTGKSHSLLSIYHLLTSPVEGKGWIKKWGLDISLPENVRVIVSHLLDEDPDFLWEPVFRKAGREDSLTQINDFPTVSQIKDLLSDSPTVIILDELESWYSAIPDRIRRERNLNFLQNLAEATSDISLKLVTFASIYGRDWDLLARLGREKIFLSDLGSSEDKVKVVLFRLFKHINEDEAKKIVERYVKVYSSQKETVGSVVGSIDEYRSSMIRNYPLHPELVKVLFQTYASSTNYQNTRGILYLLSGAIKNAYKKKDLLLTGDIDPEAEEIHDDLFQLRADLLDRCIQDIRRNKDEPLSKSLLATILLYSLAADKPGCDTSNVVLGTLTPELNINEVDRVLGKVEVQSWFLWRIQGRYVLRVEENLPLSINSRAKRRIKDEGTGDAKLRLAEIMKQYLKPAEVYVYPLEQILDSQQIKIAVSLKHLDDEEIAKNIFHGRQWRNTIILIRPKIVGDLVESEDLLLRIERLIVCEEMEKEVSKEKIAQLRELKEREKSELDSRIGGVYGEWLKPITGERLLFRPIECSLNAQQIFTNVREAFGSEVIDDAIITELTEAKEKGRKFEEIRTIFLKQLGKPVLVDLEALKNRVLSLCDKDKIILEKGKSLYRQQNPPPYVADDMVMYLREYSPAQVFGPQVPISQTPTLFSTGSPSASGETGQTSGTSPPQVVAEPTKVVSFETKEYATPFNLQTEAEGRLVSEDRIRKVTLFIQAEGLQDTAKLEQMTADIAQGALKMDVEMELQFPQSIGKDQLLKLLEKTPVPLRGQIKAKIEIERRKSQDSRAAWDKYLEEFKEQQ